MSTRPDLMHYTDAPLPAALIRQRTPTLPDRLTSSETILEEMFDAEPVADEQLVRPGIGAEDTFIDESEYDTLAGAPARDVAPEEEHTALKLLAAAALLLTGGVAMATFCLFLVVSSWVRPAPTAAEPVLPVEPVTLAEVFDMAELQELQEAVAPVEPAPAPLPRAKPKRQPAPKPPAPAQPNPVWGAIP